MQLFLIFGVSFLISFIGSVQFGPVNLAVIRGYLVQGRSASVLIAIGGVLPEFIYSWLAISSINKNLIGYFKFLNWFVAILFFIIGIYYFFKKQQPLNLLGNDAVKKLNLMNGFFLALLNVQLFPFWASMVIFLQEGKFLNQVNFTVKLAFSLGATIGAFTLLLLIIEVANHRRDFLVNKLERMNLNKIYGTLFFILAVVQFLNVMID